MNGSLGVWPFIRRFWKRRYVVSIESPERLTGFPYQVRAYDEEDALRRAIFYWFENCYSERPWYEWHYEIVDA